MAEYYIIVLKQHNNQIKKCDCKQVLIHLGQCFSETKAHNICIYLGGL